MWHGSVSDLPNKHSLEREFEYFEPATKFKFGDTSFYGINNYDEYLTLLYGDYMKIPPEV